MPPFKNRQHAGSLLAEELLRRGYGQPPPPLIFALPRGGVPVAYPIAQRLGAPLEVWVVRKLGAPGQEELALGAIAAGGGRVLNPHILEGLGVSQAELEQILAREQQELKRRERLYRGDRPLPEIKGKTLVLVDDGLATGATMKATLAAARAQGAGRLVVAAPVAPPETVAELSTQADEVICLQTPVPFQAVGLWYQDFPQVSDQEVLTLLEAARRG
ncbi:phosphoribosyltransferase [Meiothermus sp. QL-1]|uniref:phosphoribosyltransferase n=1 Tax=Meiothermus sp. QL-1 TaxID=2058095 RepID=UPI000E0A510E|nr:phosphoribosyltransferase family protein [Meiothermus sp. QL-1]RDI95267.1 phosphoribosyltransferase [Meiothermus sp. QL-1]